MRRDDREAGKCTLLTSVILKIDLSTQKLKEKDTEKTQQHTIEM